MIEVSAKLIGGPVFIPGENVGCCVIFTNPPLPTHVQSRSNSDVFETLALATVQIHCLCSTNAKVSTTKGVVNTEELVTGASDTSFAPCKGDVGYIALSTKPKILFCDLRLSSGESKSYLYSETLPSESPPSYRGQLVKYCYKITIGTQRVNCPVKLLRVPLRVLAVSGIPDSNTCEDSEDLSPSNPFSESHQKDHEQSQALQIMQNITARRSPNFYNITSARGKVARFCLFKHAFKLGEDIVGTFDFVGATVPCVQFTVTLQCEECIAEEYRETEKQGKAIISYSKSHEVCLHLKQCLLNLPIPLHATPAFATDIVSLKWRLHFEFVTSIPMATVIDDVKRSWRGPSSLAIETMIWDLPIQIYPTSPCLDPQSQSKFSILI